MKIIARIIGTTPRTHCDHARRQAHGDEDHSKAGPVKTEQREWGICRAKQFKRTVALTMHDTMRFTPDKIEFFKTGDTVVGHEKHRQCHARTGHRRKKELD